MKAISIWQPWASAIAIGAKCIETRSWKPPPSQLKPGDHLLIHAGKEWRKQRNTGLTLHSAPTIAESSHWSVWSNVVGDHGSHFFRRDCWWLRCDLPFGALIAVAELVNCWPIATPDGGLPKLAKGNHCYHLPSERERALGNFTAGRYGWILANVRKLPEPIPFRGRQRLFDVPDGLLESWPPRKEA